MLEKKLYMDNDLLPHIDCEFPKFPLKNWFGGMNILIKMPQNPFPYNLATL
jgi:hypothetical protein